MSYVLSAFAKLDYTKLPATFFKEHLQFLCSSLNKECVAGLTQDISLGEAFGVAQMVTSNEFLILLACSVS
jgi:hypothetical protein